MSIEEKLKQQIEQATWDMLKPHFERGGLVVVHEDLDLVEVGAAVAEDRVDQVQHWLEGRMLVKPDAAVVETWPDEKTFNFVIIQPYVLVQNRPN